MVGPPGSGKTMLARRLPTILPRPCFAEALETTKIHSIAGLIPADQALIAQRVFRSPHHTISDAGMIGGGAHPRPGEVSLAHHGVLFLDVIPVNINLNNTSIKTVSCFDTPFRAATHLLTSLEGIRRSPGDYRGFCH